MGSFCQHATYTKASAGRHASHSFQNFLSVRPNKRHTNTCQRYVFLPDKYRILKINHENDLQFNALRSTTREAHITLQHGRLLFCFNDAFSVPRVMLNLSYWLGKPRFRGSTPGSTKRLFASLRPPNQFSSQFASYSVGTRGSNAWGIQRTRREGNHSLQPVPHLLMHKATPPLVPTSC